MAKRRKTSGRALSSTASSAASSAVAAASTGGGRGGKSASKDAANAREAQKSVHTHSSNGKSDNAEAMDLILTSEKKRSVYECDYCKADVSQQPRIRCAVCCEFDLCLDCFATTDHDAAMQRLQAAASAHSELVSDGIESSSGVLSIAAANHRQSHGYRVCDSARYPILISANRSLVGSTGTLSSLASGSPRASIFKAGARGARSSVAGADAEAPTTPDKGPDATMKEDESEDYSTPKSKRSAEFVLVQDKGIDGMSVVAPTHGNKSDETKMEINAKQAAGVNHEAGGSEMDVDDFGIGATGTPDANMSPQKQSEAMQVDEINDKEATVQATAAAISTPETNKQKKVSEGEGEQASEMDDVDMEGGKRTEEEDQIAPLTEKTSSCSLPSSSPSKTTPSASPAATPPKTTAMPMATSPFKTPSKSPSKSPLKSHTMIVADDPKSIWTAEEDLRLFEAILTHGMGNWSEVSEAITGNGSTGKTPKRCMERYFDDYLGRYGHILPQFTVVDDGNQSTNDDVTSSSNGNGNGSSLADGTPGASMNTAASPNSSNNTTNNSDGQASHFEDETIRLSKRRHAQLMRSPSNASGSSTGGRYARKKIRVVETSALPGYADYWPTPKLPPIDGMFAGKEVAREQSYKAELTFVKAMNAASSKEEADRIREEWLATRMKEPGAPTVLPPRIDDISGLPGADLAGYMPRRGDLDVEWEDDAEQSLADMEFNPGDSQQDKELKLQVLQIYSRKLDGREKRKKYLLQRGLYDYRKHLRADEEMPTDERDLVRRMRLFERFHTPQEHEKFLADILKAKRLRKEIAKLQMYRRLGIRSLAEAEKYELDKNRRQFHKLSQLQKEAELKNQGVSDEKAATASGNMSRSLPGNRSLWKKYCDIGDDEASKKKDEEQQQKQKEEGKKTGDDKKGDKSAKGKSSSKKGSKSSSKNSKSKDSKKDGGAKAGAMADGTKKSAEDAAAGTFDISNRQGYELLSRKEIKLCQRMELYPTQYLQMKKALLFQSMQQGLLDNENPNSNKRTIVKMDMKRRGQIVEFMVRAGWISSQLK